MKLAIKRASRTVAAFALAYASWMPIQSYAQVNVNITIGSEPPPPRYEVVPAPRNGYLWVPGYWNWDGRNHVWVGGHWEHSRAGYYYERPEWRRHGDEWELHRGEWRQEGRHERHHGRDEDHCPPGHRKKGKC